MAEDFLKPLRFNAQNPRQRRVYDGKPVEGNILDESSEIELLISGSLSDALTVTAGGYNLGLYPLVFFLTKDFGRNKAAAVESILQKHGYYVSVDGEEVYFNEKGILRLNPQSRQGRLLNKIVQEL